MARVSKQSFLRFATILLFIAITSCTAHHPASVVVPPPPQSTLPTEHDLLSPLTARQAQVTSLRGLARIVYKDTVEKGTARQAIAVAAPDRFRLELFSPIGIAALVTTDGHTLAAYLPQEKTIYRGAASPLNAARFLRVMLSASQVTSLLLGLPLLPLDADGGTVRLDSHEEMYVLTLPIPGGGVQIFTFDQKMLRLARWEVQTANGNVLARMTLADYRTVQGQTFPFEIMLADLQGNQEATIYYEQIELNPSLSSTLFTLAAIAGVQETNLDAASAP
jgi:outer membrane lipoprotein-sorting protein